MRRSGIKVMMKLVGLVKPLAGYMILAILLGSVGNLTAAVIPIFGAWGILNPGSIKLVVTVLLVCGISRGIFRYGEQLCNHYIAFKILAMIRHRIFEKLRELAPAKLEGKEKGNLISMITGDIEMLEVFYAHTISPIAIAVVNSVIMIVFIGRQHWSLGVVAGLGYLVIGAVIPLLCKGEGGAAGYEYRERLGRMNSFFLDSIRGLPEIMQFGMGVRRLEMLNGQTDEVEGYNKKLKDQEGNNKAVTESAIFIISTGMLVLGGILYFGQVIDFDAALLAFITMISTFGPVVALSSLSNNLFHTIASGNRILDLLEEEPLLHEINGCEPARFGKVQMSGIDFAYDTEKILENVDLQVQPGEIIGIHGKSGSGKSTLLKLFMRFYQPDSGTISINDRSIETINTPELRGMESYVTQETCLFHDSIRENIRIAKADASDEEVTEAAKKAAIHDFIINLPNGYDTNTGELGACLSGGEKQRIGVARAFLHDAPLVLLDEPTSNLDSLNEGVILKALETSRSDKTIILVSHRKSTMGIVDSLIEI